MTEFRHDVTGRTLRVREGTRVAQLVTEKGSGWSPVEAQPKRRRRSANQEAEQEPQSSGEQE